MNLIKNLIVRIVLSLYIGHTIASQFEGYYGIISFIHNNGKEILI